MRSLCRSKRGAPRWARMQPVHAAALLMALGGCTELGTSHTPDTDATPTQATHPTTWYAASPGHKPATADAGAPQAQPDSGGVVTPTPVGSAADSGAASGRADAGGSDPDVEETPPEEPQPRATLIFNLSATTYSPMPVLQELSVRSVRELFIHSVWSGLKGQHTETRKFYSPSGELYYEKLTAFSTDIAAPAAFERQVDIPHNASVQATPLDAHGNLIVSDYLSIAGTWISDRAMTGIWTVEVYLDDAPKPSVTSDLELSP